MAIKPMLFNTEMAQAILEGRKTVTRRVIKPQPEGQPILMGPDSCWPGYFAIQGTGKVICPPFCVRDVIWVRETWMGWYAPHGELVYFYKATDQNANKAPTGPAYDDAWEVRNWRPSIHMPKEAARIFLRVTDVWGERLQDINGLHAKEEGCEGYVHINPLYGCPETVHNFKALWNSTIKPADRPTYGWEANPYVWVIEFERCEKPEGWPC